MKKPCFDYALSHISNYPKTTSDLKQFLLRKEYDKQEIDEAVARLIKMGFVDDAVYTRLTLSSDVCRNGKPIRAIEQKLIKKGVDKSVITQERAELEDEIQEGMRTKIIKLVERLKDRGYDDFKIIKNLAGKGYPFDLVKELVDS